MTKTMHNKSRYSNYHYCLVQKCRNTSISTPNKLWIKVPTKEHIRNAWMRLANREPLTLSSGTQLYICEDHFNLENDMENYMEYKIMGSIKRIRMKPGCMPSKFDGESGNKRKHFRIITQHASKKRAIAPLVDDDKQDHCNGISLSMKQELQDVESIPTYPSSHQPTSPVKSRVYAQEAQTQEANVSQETKTPSSVQVHKVIRKDDSPIKPVNIDIPIKLNKSSQKRSNKSSMDCNPFKPPNQNSTYSLQQNIIQVRQLNLKNTLSKVNLKPMLYTGIPKELYFIINLISEHTKLSVKYILLCLMKVRLNRTFSELADDFDVSQSQATRIFYNNIPLIVSFFLPYVKTFPSNIIKRNLPIGFRHKYNKVNFIVDCLEVEIDKPKKAVHQSLTWSEFKRVYTCKYLIACTPDGLISFVSSGYGGKTSDVDLLVNSKFLESLEPRSCIFANSNFNEIEKYLEERSFMLLRPYVEDGPTLDHSDIKQSKSKVNLQIHMERVIERLNQFSLFKSVVNLNELHILDFCIIIACAIINLQYSHE